MPRHWLATAIMVCACACVDRDDADDDVVPLPSDDAHAAITNSLDVPDADYNICEHLPASGPCSVLCDRAALEEYVPESSCAVFVCELTDGQTVSVHACHPPR